MRKNLEVIGNLPVLKKDFKDLEGFLKRNDLLDSRNIWFAGFDNKRRGDQNAVAGNLFYGNSRLMVVCLNGDDVLYLQNSRQGFQIYKLGTVDEKFKVHIGLGLMSPPIEIDCPRENYLEIKVTKNKKAVKEFKSIVK